MSCMMNDYRKLLRNQIEISNDKRKAIISALLRKLAIPLEAWKNSDARYEADKECAKRL